MRIAVCDDEVATLMFITTHIRNEFEKKGERITVSSYLNAAKLLRDITEKRFDAVFLDIRMPDPDGFKTAKGIRDTAPETKIIFVTSEEALVFDSFDFQPFAFIPKTPGDVMLSRLSHTVGNLITAITARRKICIELPYNDKIYVKTEDVVYVKSEKNNLFYHLSSGEEIITRSKIQNAAELLPADLFVRIHNRFIVNLNHIKAIEYSHSSLTVTGDEELGISRSCKAAFDEAYYRWLKNQK